MRAKNKSFNAEIKTGFDEAIGKSKIVEKITDKNFNYAKTTNKKMVGGYDPGDRIDHPKHLYFQ